MNGSDAVVKTIAVLGLGEAGSLLARDLVRGGATVRGWDPDFHGDLSEIPLAASFAAAVEGADIVISVNWASVAAAVAREALPSLHRGMLYADHNTAGPTLKRELAAIVEPSGAAFVDGTAKHAVRRGHEMRDAEAMLLELGTPTAMVTATAESLERIVREKKVLAHR